MNIKLEGIDNTLTQLFENNTYLNQKSFKFLIDDDYDFKISEIQYFIICLLKRNIKIENFDFFILSKSGGIYDNLSIKKYIDLDVFLTNFKKELKITENQFMTSRAWPLKKVLNANRIIDDFTDTVMNSKINDRELSPLEKYMMIYNFASAFEYNEVENYPTNSYAARNIVDILNGNNIVCVGYSSLIKTLCDKVGIPCFKTNVQVKKNSSRKQSDEFVFSSNHQANTVFIKDEIYNIDGCFYSDSCWDSKRKNETVGRHNFFLLPISDLKFMKNYTFNILDNSFIDSFYNKKTVYNCNKSNFQINKLLSEHKQHFSNILSNSRLLDYNRLINTEKLENIISSLPNIKESFINAKLKIKNIVNKDSVINLNDESEVDDFLNIFSELIFEKNLSQQNNEILTRIFTKKSSDSDRNYYTNVYKLLDSYCDSMIHHIALKKVNFKLYKETKQQEIDYISLSQCAYQYAENSKNHLNISNYIEALTNVSTLNSNTTLKEIYLNIKINQLYAKKNFKFGAKNLFSNINDKKFTSSSQLENSEK